MCRIGYRANDQARQGALGSQCRSDRRQVLALGNEELAAEADPQIPLLGGLVLPGGVAGQIIDLPPAGRPELMATVTNGPRSAAVTAEEYPAWHESS
ncbi:hypothetical protein [Nocardia niwae]|uniref:hypothetical protein n=1 Tax=Nocardia niwae TaxID=626084 RepID=UPI0034085345